MELTTVIQLDRAEHRSEHRLEIVYAVEKCVLSIDGPGTRDVKIKKMNVSFTLLELTFLQTDNEPEEGE